MLGKCLCGEIVFEVTGTLPDFYQCHCSLCRKLSGSSSDTATFLDARQFQWLSELENVSSYTTQSGYRSDFCNHCGSTVPHLMNNGTQYWVPAGLLEDQAESVVAAHLFVDSKASWDNIGGDGHRYSKMPEMDELNGLLQAKTKSSMV